MHSFKGFWQWFSDHTELEKKCVKEETSHGTLDVENKEKS